MTDQQIQDKYGYVVMGGEPCHEYQIGEIVGGVKGKDGPEYIGPLIVTGFATINEWRKQRLEAMGSFDERLALRFWQFLKLKAE